MCVCFFCVCVCDCVFVCVFVRGGKCSSNVYTHTHAHTFHALTHRRTPVPPTHALPPSRPPARPPARQPVTRAWTWPAQLVSDSEAVNQRMCLATMKQIMSGGLV